MKMGDFFLDLALNTSRNCLFLLSACVLSELANQGSLACFGKAIEHCKL